FSGVDPAVAVAFVQYLAATPAAQRVLAHPRSDIPTLLRSARAGPSPRALSEPMVLSSYRHVAIASALDVLWPRRFGGYPVAGEPRPTEHEVMELIRQRSPDVVANTSQARLR